MKQSYTVALGFLFFFLGALSIILTLVGMKFDLLGFLYKISRGFALLVHLIFMFGGICMIYYAKNKEKINQERQESES
jgi:ABC-type uncharacterized transport system fused permease/ATPase subunit